MEGRRERGEETFLKLTISVLNTPARELWHGKRSVNKESRAKPARLTSRFLPKTSARELHQNNAGKNKTLRIWAEGSIQPITSEPVRRLGLGYASGATPMRAITLAVSLAVQLIKLKYLLTGAGSHGRIPSKNPLIS
jgi:hypothetical protein